MAIEMRDVCVRTKRTLTPVSLANINIRIEPTQHVAILTASKPGLEMLVDVICGANAPDSGSVICDSRLSWPLPGAKFLHSHQTFIANARFVARLYEMDQKSFIERVIDMAAVGDLADEKVSYCPKAAISRFSFALGACLPFDTYFFTGTNVGDKEDREKYASIIADLAQRSGLLLATSSGKIARPYCDTAYVIQENGAVFYDDIDAAIEHLDRLAKKMPSEDGDEGISDLQSSSLSDDFL
jgi:capsular polysaccharide transport system ATP-binding protein